jgi:hypothetical protein
MKSPGCRHIGMIVKYVEALSRVLGLKLSVLLRMSEIRGGGEGSEVEVEREIPC